MSEREDYPKDWKLKLRYGRLKTPYQHFNTISDGVFDEPASDFDCPAGPAIMTMRVWSSYSEEAAHMASLLGDDVGFTVTGDIQIYETPPEEPPRDGPYGYGIGFSPYDPDQ